MAAKPIKSLELHYTMIQFLLRDLIICSDQSKRVFLLLVIHEKRAGCFYNLC